MSGVVLLRVSKDVEDIRLETLARRSFAEAHFPHINAYFPTRRERAAVRKRRSRVTLGYAFLLAALSCALTLAGVEAALWHMAPWVAEVSLVTLALSLALLILVVVFSQPPASKGERRLKAWHRDAHGAGASEPTVNGDPPE